MLTIKSGKKGPQIKKGITEASIVLIKTEFEYLGLFMTLSYVIIYFLILITLFLSSSIILVDFKSLFKFSCGS